MVDSISRHDKHRKVLNDRCDERSENGVDEADSWSWPSPLTCMWQTVGKEREREGTATAVKCFQPCPLGSSILKTVFVKNKI